MAFEAIFSELFEMNINPFYQERDRIIELAIAMNLNDENNIVLGGRISGKIKSICKSSNLKLME